MNRWFFAVLCAASVSAQPRQQQNWTLTGSVTDSITGKPIAGALVVWEPSFTAFGFKDRPLDSGPSFEDARTTTDSSGAFTLSVDATATGVRLFVSRAGFRSTDGKPVVALSVAAGVMPASIRMTPQSVIQGRVSNRQGEALGGVEIQATRIEIRDGRRQPHETYVRTSPASGEFRFENLRPGSYYLRAAGNQASTPAAYGPVYYPNAESEDEAQLLSVAPGNLLRADFRLESHKAYVIRGLITNMPLRHKIEIRLMRGDDPLSNATSITPNGTFAVAGVAPGSYTLQAYSPEFNPPDFGEVDVTVQDHDANAIKIALSEGVDIAGRVEFSGAASLVKYAVVYATPFDSRRIPVDLKPPVATMRPNGDFLFKNLIPGKYEITVRGMPDVYLAETRAVSRDGSKDIMEQGLTVPVRDPPTLNIVMKAGGGEISGTIDGAKPGDAFIVALVIRHGATDIPMPVRAQDGRFRMGDLAPGDYTLLAWPESREIEYRNPAVLAELLRDGTAVSLAYSARREVHLTPLPSNP